MAGTAAMLRLSQRICNSDIQPFDELIQSVAGEMERIFHDGTPSGIDTFVSQYGGVVQYQRDANKGILTKKLEFDSLDDQDLLIVDTGVARSTANMVALVRMQMERDPVSTAQVFDAINESVARILTGNTIIKDNLLEEIHVNPKISISLDPSVEVARISGIFGCLTSQDRPSCALGQRSWLCGKAYWSRRRWISTTTNSRGQITH